MSPRGSMPMPNAGSRTVLRMRDLLMKWVSKVEGVETVEDMTQLYWTEVLSKVDISTYGQ